MFISSEDGQGLVEYALLAALIGIVVIAILISLGDKIGALYQVVTALQVWH